MMIVVRPQRLGSAAAEWFLREAKLVHALLELDADLLSISQHATDGGRRMGAAAVTDRHETCLVR